MKTRKFELPVNKFRLKTVKIPQRTLAEVKTRVKQVYGESSAVLPKAIIPLPGIRVAALCDRIWNSFSLSGTKLFVPYPRPIVYPSRIRNQVYHTGYSSLVYFSGIPTFFRVYTTIPVYLSWVRYHPYHTRIIQILFKRR